MASAVDDLRRLEGQVASAAAGGVSDDRAVAIRIIGQLDHYRLTVELGIRLPI